MRDLVLTVQRADRRVSPTVHEIGQRLMTQDNRITSEPVFMVQERHRIYGISEGYTDDFRFVSKRDHEDVGAVLDEDDDPNDFHRVGIKDIWINVQPFFTEIGAKQYIQLNGHNLREPRIYVESGYRNAEWIEIRAFFKSLVNGKKAKPSIWRRLTRAWNTLAHGTIGER